MKPFIKHESRLLLLATIILGGCAMLQDYTGSLPIPEHKITLVVGEKYKYAVEGCQFLLKLSESSGWGGLTEQKRGRLQVVQKMAFATDTAKGNIAYIAKLESGFWGASGEGDAYYCDEAHVGSTNWADVEYYLVLRKQPGATVKAGDTVGYIVWSGPGK